MIRQVNAKLSKNIAKKYHQELKQLVKSPFKLGSLDRLIEDVKKQELWKNKQRSIRRTAAKALFWHELSLMLISKKDPQVAYEMTIKSIKDDFDERCLQEIFAGGSFFGSKRTYDLVESCHLDKDRIHTPARGLCGNRWGIFGWFRSKLVDSFTEMMNKARIHRVSLDNNIFYEFSFSNQKEATACAQDVYNRKLVTKKPPNVRKEEDGRYFFNIYHADFENIQTSYSLPQRVYPLMKPTELFLTEIEKLERAWTNTR